LFQFLISNKHLPKNLSVVSAPRKLVDINEFVDVPEFTNKL